MKKKVVIVEDDRLLSIVLKKMATSMNFEVLDTSQGGQDAIESVTRNKPDLILMDILLADNVTGIEAMKKIRETTNTPVIYISALSDESVRREATGISNSFYLTKPVNMHELKSAIDDVQFVA
ncbi:MAG: response regulator [Balneolaceae bacterium]|nr:response regulator [Balneolaceae bacterium]MCH8548014.1 response regulator [Balneolaceae bacterium]